MQSKAIIHPWIDDSFFERGSFITTDDGKMVLLLKSGEVSQQSISSLKKCLSISCKNFFEDKYHYHHSDQFLKISLEELRLRMTDSGPMPSLKRLNDYDHLFKEDFERLKITMPHEVRKAVLVSREEYQTSDPVSLKKHLFAKALEMKKGKAYGFWDQDQGIVGCTPETLFEVENGQLTTEALAGTAKQGNEVELLNSLKDRNEHEFVVKDISEKLSGLGLQPHIGQTETSQFSTMIHLRTKLSAKINSNLSVQRIGEALSPTAALGGYPQKTSKAFLLRTKYNQQFPERIFGSVIATEHEGSVGLVMIRNVQWKGENFFIESGVGVVEESNFSAELEELNFKRSVIRNHYL